MIYLPTLFAVYQLTCSSCDQQYIGSTTRFIHDRVKEHLNNKNSSVKKHIYSCKNKDYKGIEVKIIMSENDPANLRLYGAFYIPVIVDTTAAPALYIVGQ